MRKGVLILSLCLIITTALAAATFPPTSVPTISGIDVSAWQRTIDWNAVAADGVRIAMIRATEGDGFVDPYFERNARGAKSAGVAAGYYHFMTATTVAQAESQADFFASAIAAYEPECLLALDFGGGSSLSGEALTACAEAFLARVAARTGLGVMLYTDAWAAKARYGESLAKYPIWVANYGVEEPEANGKWSAWVGFQHSDRGSVSGIAGNVDLDRFTAQVYQGAPPTPTPTPTPIINAETLYYEAPANASVSSVASKLGTTQEQLRSLNDVVGDTVQQGQVLRYPSSRPSSGAAFGGLHILRPMEGLHTLANHYGTTVSTLVSLNAFTSSSVPLGQIVRIPAVPSRQDVAAPPSWLLENVAELQQGQTIAELSSMYGVSVADLNTINGLAAGQRVYAGQLIHLQAYGNDESNAFRGGYVVRRGDTLTRIAERFGVTAAALYQLNNIANRNLIYPGQILLLPE